MANVLVIEDSPDSAFLIGSTLSGAGHSVTLTANRDEGRQALAKDAFDCVILDYYMQGTTAFEFMRFLKTLDSRVPVILCTAAYEPETVAGTLGIQYLLKKPFMPENLVAMVERACQATPRRQSYS
jgi:CheY-like chemotaxis protein